MKCNTYAGSNALLLRHVALAPLKNTLPPPSPGVAVRGQRAPEACEQVRHRRILPLQHAARHMLPGGKFATQIPLCSFRVFFF